MTPSKPQQIPVPTLPNAPPPPPVIANSPTGSKPGAKTPTPSFLNAAATPAKGQMGTKQLVGQ